MIIPMTKNANGDWQYTDPAENDMVFELEAISGHELTSFDVLLNDVAQWAGYEKAHAHLVGLRHDLVYKFKRYFDDTEAIELAVQAYWLALQATRMQITGTTLEKAKNKHSATQSQRRRGKGKALTPAQERRLVYQYQNRVFNGEKWGAIRELAAQFRTSETTVKTLLKNAK